MPINAPTIASGPGQSITANVSIGFLANVWYDFPVYQSFPESGSQVIGTVLIVNENGLGLAIIILPLLVIVAVFSIAYLKRDRLFGSKRLRLRESKSQAEDS